MGLFRIVGGAALAAGLLAGSAHAAGYQHVLLVSIDGLHQADLARFIESHRGSALAKLAKSGKIYQNAETTKPSDSFPGMLALVTGGTPAAQLSWPPCWPALPWPARLMPRPISMYF